MHELLPDSTCTFEAGVEVVANHVCALCEFCVVLVVCTTVRDDEFVRLQRLLVQCGAAEPVRLAALLIFD